MRKAPRKPNTNIASDKDRIAMTRHPELNVKELRKILASPPAGAPGLSAPQMAQQPLQPSAGVAQNQPCAASSAAPSQIAQLQTPKPDIKKEFSKYGGSMTAGERFRRRPAPPRRRRQGGGGDGGLGTGAHGRQVGNLEILSDTMGVTSALTCSACCVT